jgi:hypothetical protein
MGGAAMPQSPATNEANARPDVSAEGVRPSSPAEVKYVLRSGRRCYPALHCDCNCHHDPLPRFGSRLVHEAECSNPTFCSMSGHGDNCGGEWEDCGCIHPDHCGTSGGRPPHPSTVNARRELDEWVACGGFQNLKESSHAWGDAPADLPESDRDTASPLAIPRHPQWTSADLRFRRSVYLRSMHDVIEGEECADTVEDLAWQMDDFLIPSLSGRRGSPGQPCWIYFIMTEECPTRIKIGRTLTLKSRFSNLQTASPMDLRLVAAFRGTSLHEAALHQAFADCRVRGEWFAPSYELIDLIRIIQVEG